MSEDAFADTKAVTASFMAVDWSRSVLGPIADWPQSLRSAVSICLASPYPMAIYWGQDLALIYNDAWSPILGSKHPDAMGKPGREVWPEIWHLVGPQLTRTLTHGESTRQPDGLLPMHRHGYVEECYFDYAFSPIRSEGGNIGGVFNAVVETTYRVINSRRTRLLKDISDRAARAESDEQVCLAATEAFASDPQDVPFALLVLYRDSDEQPQVAAHWGVPDTLAARMREVITAAGDGISARSASAQEFQVIALPDDVRRSGLGPWPEGAQAAAIIPLTLVGHGRLGLLMVGISARRALDEEYQSFLDAIGDQLVRALAHARTIDEARRRAEALAAIDRAKTAFFSNVSHEFRTPLTLMLGPIDESLRDTQEPLSSRQRERQELVQRNGERLLRLVNSLLDFSRIEAGRARASFTSTDLAPFTAEVASSFRSAVESAGLAFVIDCPSLANRVHVDREMWEKIVLNLLSNAFKHTFNGRIAVRLQEVDGHAELRVEDTGVGIPADQVPRLFERFHRVHGARSRTHEGTGIGLALVHDLIRLHGGTVAIASEVDRGTTFTVRIPLGTAHLPADQIAAPATSEPVRTLATPFVDEATRWLPPRRDEPTSVVASGTAAPSSQPNEWILLAEDNADMRAYVRRLLESRWRVIAVEDGEAALAEARRHAPGLILSDIMMPRLDGVGLLRAVRAEAGLRDTPVVLLSARAGEEAGIEGREAGADDYLTKPFSAQELIARVAAQFHLKRLRADVTRELRLVVERLSLAQVSASFGVWEYDPIGQRGIPSPECADLFGFARDMPPEENLAESFRRIHPDDVLNVKQRLAEAVHSQETVTWEYRFRHPAKGDRWLMSRARCVTDPTAAPRVIGVTVDMTEQKSAAVALQIEKDRWRQLAEAMPHLVWTCQSDGACDYLSRQWVEYTGKPAAEQLGDRWLDQVHVDDRATVAVEWERAHHDGVVFDVEFRIRRHDGTYRWFKTRAVPVNKGTESTKWYGTNTDIHDLKTTQSALLDAERRLALAAEGSGLGTFDWHFASGAMQWSRSHFTLFGYDPATTTPSQEAWRQCIHPDDLAGFEAAVEQARRDDSPLIAEYRINRHDDRGLRWIAVFGRVLREEGPAESRLVGVLFDITARKQAELDLAKRADELDRANGELQHFASIASHDLQEPLRMISNYTDILAHRYSSLFDNKATQYFDRIITGAQRMRALIEALLAYSQVDKMPSQLQQVPAAEALRDALEHLQANIVAQRAEVKVLDLPTVFVDRIRLTQLFQNLVSNALKFSAPDREPRIEIAAKPMNAEWVFSVVDNGIGIAEQSRERVFRIFQRLHAPGTYPGSGIGLASCKKIVEQYGGRIWVESVPEVGSSFYFSIPMQNLT